MQDTYLDVYICMYAHMYVCISVYVNVYVYYLFVSMVYLDEVLLVSHTRDRCLLFNYMMFSTRLSARACSLSN